MCFLHFSLLVFVTSYLVWLFYLLFSLSYSLVNHLGYCKIVPFLPTLMSGMLIHTYPHKPLMKIKFPSAITRLTAHFTCDLMSALVIYNHRKDGYTWHWMSFLRPGGIKQHKTQTQTLFLPWRATRVELSPWVRLGIVQPGIASWTSTSTSLESTTIKVSYQRHGFME